MPLPIATTLLSIDSRSYSTFRCAAGTTPSENDMLFGLKYAIEGTDTKFEEHEI